MKAADIFALNTNYEGLSHVLLEAMALGTPVVTTPAGGNIELVVNGETGLLADFNQRAVWLVAIKTLLTDQVLADKIAAQAKIFTAQNFSREQMLGELSKELD
jgi:glycosyltransferase involved in cell wall biosynthesis